MRILSPSRNALATQQIVTETSGEAISVLSVQMHRIILEADISMKNLDRLEIMLHGLHGIISNENASISAAKENLLAELWTMLGGNRRKLRGIDGHLVLLEHLGSYRMRAAAHVACALQALIGMSEDMEDLRERVTAPEFIGSKIPLEVHIRSIRAGLDRLREDRTRVREVEREREGEKRAMRGMLTVEGAN
jgi:hypothetical protein